MSAHPSIPLPALALSAYVVLCILQCFCPNGFIAGIFDIFCPDLQGSNSAAKRRLQSRRKSAKPSVFDDEDQQLAAADLIDTGDFTVLIL